MCVIIVVVVVGGGGGGDAATGYWCFCQRLSFCTGDTIADFSLLIAFEFDYG